MYLIWFRRATCCGLRSVRPDANRADTAESSPAIREPARPVNFWPPIFIPRSVWLSYAAFIPQVCRSGMLPLHPISPAESANIECSKREDFLAQLSVDSIELYQSSDGFERVADRKILNSPYCRRTHNFARSRASCVIGVSAFFFGPGSAKLRSELSNQEWHEEYENGRPTRYTVTFHCRNVHANYISNRRGIMHVESRTSHWNYRAGWSLSSRTPAKQGIYCPRHQAPFFVVQFRAH